MSLKKEKGDSRFPKSVFWIVLGALLLTSGVSVGIIVGMYYVGWPPIIQAHIMVFYWLLTALCLTWLLRARMKAAYDEPLQMISAATKQVAAGDFSVRIDPIHGEDKEDYLDVMIRDLNAMIAELGSIETLKTDFVSNVSHELKTPISVIQNYAQLLQARDLSEEDRQEYTRAISDASIRLSALISNILRLNRLENQKLAPAAKEYDLSSQLTECILGFESIWEEKDVEIAPDIEDDIMICSDQELLSIVWNNLLSNAFKFTETGGTVAISLKDEDGYAVVSIKDTGCGMSPETAKHIFDKFYQGDTSHSTQGNGLGLALARRIMDITGGEISVESQPGEGSTFNVRLRKHP